MLKKPSRCRTIPFDKYHVLGGGHSNARIKTTLFVRQTISGGQTIRTDVCTFQSGLWRRGRRCTTGPSNERDERNQLCYALLSVGDVLPIFTPFHDITEQVCWQRRAVMNNTLKLVKKAHQNINIMRISCTKQLLLSVSTRLRCTHLPKPLHSSYVWRFGPWPALLILGIQANATSM